MAHSWLVTKYFIADKVLTLAQSKGQLAAVLESENPPLILAPHGLFLDGQLDSS